MTNSSQMLGIIDRIEYKRDHHEAIIEAVLEDGNWESSVI